MRAGDKARVIRCDVVQYIPLVIWRIFSVVLLDHARGRAARGGLRPGLGTPSHVCARTFDLVVASCSQGLLILVLLRLHLQEKRRDVVQAQAFCLLTDNAQLVSADIVTDSNFSISEEQQSYSGMASQYSLYQCSVLLVVGNVWIAALFHEELTYGPMAGCCCIEKTAAPFVVQMVHVGVVRYEHATDLEVYISRRCMEERCAAVGIWSVGICTPLQKEAASVAALLQDCFAERCAPLGP
mmetsp:Transcript_16720/g.29835  ORF Transcript_16720/g.29835 Transcript_16720/m.29835 type:complete len:240 (+) Transcript_16720:307-1026(+)